jgi:MoaA/NifB/PqqE/SkfB family radical SAM enzyme
MLDPGIRIQRKLGVAAVELAPEIPAPLPRILWIELTSKCPFDCIFCSRRLRRGDGEHMDFGLYRSLIRQLDRPEVVRLNYSGESVHYPWLVEAIELAKSAGATVELVSALASISPALLEGVAASGLDRLTVSLHTMDPAEDPGWTSPSWPCTRTWTSWARSPNTPGKPVSGRSRFSR